VTAPDLSLSDLPLAVGLFVVNAEKNIMNHISTLFESIVSSLPRQCFPVMKCKVVMQYCLRWQKGVLIIQLVKSQSRDTVGTG
jgi:predicted benzoate:H+ symporter BenE